MLGSDARLAAPSPAGDVLPLSISPPAGDSSLLDGRFAAFVAELQPVGDLELSLTQRAALLTVRLDRSARHEAAALAERVRGAITAFDEARRAEVDRLFVEINDQPAPSVQAFRRMPEGIDRMLIIWTGLRSDLLDGQGERWKDRHRGVADCLRGLHPHAQCRSPFQVLTQNFHDAANQTRSDATPDPAAVQRREHARGQILQAIDAQIADLQAARARIDFQAIARDRAGAADRALFDPSPEATLARKHEAATERSLFRTLRELRDLREAREATSVPPETPPIPAHDPRPLGSFRPERFAAEPPAAEPVAPTFPRELEPLQPGRTGSKPVPKASPPTA